MTLRIDEQVAAWMDSIRRPWFDAAASGLFRFATSATGVILLGVLVILLCGARRRMWTLLSFAVASVGTWAGTHYLAALIARPHPGEPHQKVMMEGFSMPSPVAAVVAAGLTTLLVLRGRTTWGRWGWGFLLALIDVAVCFTLLYVGAHWLTDVVAGTAVGLVLGALCLMFHLSAHKAWDRRHPRD